MITLKTKVERILEGYPETRNSDTLLTSQLWKVFHRNALLTKDGINFYIKVEDISKLPREDHIKRYRARIQNQEHRFPPTDPEILKKRQHLEGEWHNEFSNH